MDSELMNNYSYRGQIVVQIQTLTNELNRLSENLPDADTQ
jgi:hypothetical protein